MRIIILGAGRVGESVAESLVSERNDITVIDPDPQRLRELEEKPDLRGVPGNGIHAEVMRRPGAEDADMLIACAFGVLNEFQLWVRAFAMLIGRLELLSVLVLFTPQFWRK